MIRRPRTPRRVRAQKVTRVFRPFANCEESETYLRIDTLVLYVSGGKLGPGWDWRTVQRIAA